MGEAGETGDRPSPPVAARNRGDGPRPDLSAGADLLPKIQHIVVLMMENHSYDNYFGLLTGRGEGLPLGPAGVPVAVNYVPNGQAFHAHALPSSSPTTPGPGTCAGPRSITPRCSS
ncbi:MAG: alkaline phosphatase family protein [Streptosporangiaceae bacterium]